ncbi:MAG TPA: SRPBCC domain-containing protein [Chryseosolibacter sp.]|nr:SRPBCC domain-containing protein [Chryseosolibacter sp.]
MPNIHHAVVIVADAEKVYRAITSEEGLSAWWTPYTKATPEPGSISRFNFGQDYFKEMKITEMTPNEHVQWACLKGADEWIGTTISFILNEGDKKDLLYLHPEATDQILQNVKDGNATLLTMHHGNWRQYSPMFAECNYTWGQFLRSLKLYCETGNGQPWPGQHSIR